MRTDEIFAVLMFFFNMLQINDLLLLLGAFLKKGRVRILSTSRRLRRRRQSYPRQNYCYSRSKKRRKNKNYC